MDEKTRQLLAQAKEYYAGKEYDRAIPLLVRIIEEGGGRYADIHHMLGQIYFDKGDFGRAQEYFESAVRLNPKFTDAVLALSITYGEVGKYEDANKLQSFARNQMANVACGPVDPFVKGKIANMHAEIGSAYVEAGMLAEAILEYEKALCLCPSFADLWTRRGHILREMGDKGKARESYEKAVEANPQFIPARLHLGLLIFQEGDREGAIGQWREVLKISRDNRSARMYLKTFAGIDVCEEEGRAGAPECETGAPVELRGVVGDACEAEPAQGDAAPAPEEAEGKERGGDKEGEGEEPS